MLEYFSEAFICGVIWGLTNLFITRGLNPKTRDHFEYYVDESIYGGLAVTLNVIIIIAINSYVKFC